MKPLFLALGLGSSACAGNPPPTHYTLKLADPHPWESYFEAVTDATAEWSAATGLPIDVEVNADGCGTCGVICVHSEPFGPTTPVEGQLGGYTHQSSNWSADVVLASGLDEPTAHALAVHELGHALGLEHVSDSADAMYPVVPIGVKVAVGDVAQFRSVYGEH